MAHVDSLPRVLALYSPSTSDWVVSILLRTHRLIVRRVTPGTITREHAVAVALQAEEIPATDCREISVARLGETRGIVASVAADDHFAALITRMRP